MSLMTTEIDVDENYDEFMKQEVLKKATEIIKRGSRTRAESVKKRTRTASSSSKKKNTKGRTSSSGSSIGRRNK